MCYVVKCVALAVTEGLKKIKKGFIYKAVKLQK